MCHSTLYEYAIDRFYEGAIAIGKKAEFLAAVGKYCCESLRDRGEDDYKQHIGRFRLHGTQKDWPRTINVDYEPWACMFCYALQGMEKEDETFMIDSYTGAVNFHVAIRGFMERIQPGEDFKLFAPYIPEAPPEKGFAKPGKK